MKPEAKASCSTCYGAREVTQPAYTGTFMGRTFPIGAKQVACPACSVTTVRAVRTHRTTKQQSIVMVTFECRYRENQPVVAITDGVTGYESVYFDDHFLDGCRAKGWLACAGSLNRYDSLFVPAKEMRLVFERLLLA